MIARLLSFWHGLRHGHTYALKFRDGVPGYVCVECLHWTRSPFTGEIL